MKPTKEQISKEASYKARHLMKNWGFLSEGFLTDLNKSLLRYEFLVDIFVNRFNKNYLSYENSERKTPLNNALNINVRNIEDLIEKESEIIGEREITKDINLIGLDDYEVIRKLGAVESPKINEIIVPGLLIDKLTKLRSDYIKGDVHKLGVFDLRLNKNSFEKCNIKLEDYEKARLDSEMILFYSIANEFNLIREETHIPYVMDYIKSLGKCGKSKFGNIIYIKLNKEDEPEEYKECKDNAKYFGINNFDEQINFLFENWRKLGQDYLDKISKINSKYKII